MISMIEKAQIVADGAHNGQVRKYTGEPYIAHPTRVVGLLQEIGGEVTDEMICAAWLHDVVEDCGVTLDAVAESFGPLVADLVEELTKPNEPKTAQAMIIKACDLIDNIGSIAEVAPAGEAVTYLNRKERQVDRIVNALWVSRPLLATALEREYNQNLADAVLG